MKKNRKFWESKILWLSVNILLVFMIFLIEVYPIEKPIWWSDLYSLFLSISTGGLVSFFFYWLVVFTPEQRKRQTIKSNLFRMYQMIKEDIAYQVVFASIKGGRTDLTADVNTISKLLTTTGFREAFEGGREGDEGFYAFENQMSNLTPEFQAIIINLEMLSSQIGFILHNYTIDDGKIFDFFKKLELILISLRHSSPGYDESKPLCRFVYETFSGWSWEKGYLGHDMIEKMISEI